MNNITNYKKKKKKKNYCNPTSTSKYITGRTTRGAKKGSEGPQESPSVSRATNFHGTLRIHGARGCSRNHGLWLPCNGNPDDDLSVDSFATGSDGIMESFRGGIRRYSRQPSLLLPGSPKLQLRFRRPRVHRPEVGARVAEGPVGRSIGTRSLCSRANCRPLIGYSQ